MATDLGSGSNHDEPNQGGLWAITYTITPDRGYFDRAEPILWTDDVYFETIEAMEFLEDGSVVVTYGVDGSSDALRTRLEGASERVISYALSDGPDALVAQLRFYPDETLERILGVQKSLGYYETPRGATHEDIATELECSKSVVGQHLRQIERSLVEHVVSV